MRTTGLPLVARALLFGLLYVFAAHLMVGTRAFQQAVIWLPTGFAVLGLWMLGLRFWPLLTAVVILQRLLIGYTFETYAFGVVANTLEAITAVVLLRRLDFRPALRRLRDVLALVVAAGVAPVVGATIGRSRWFLQPDSLSWYEGWSGWWRMNALGILVVAPLVFSWSGRRPRWPSLRALGEGLAVALGFLALGLFLAPRDAVGASTGMVLSYLALPLALYAAIRFGVRGATAAAACAVTVLTVGTAYGYGPFAAASASPATRELALQAVVAIVMVTPLLLGAAIAEREAAKDAILVERERREELLASINRNLNDGLFRSSPEHGLLYVNTAFAQMLGYERPEDLLGRRPESLVADSSDERTLRSRYESTGSLMDEEITLVRRDGSPIRVLLRCTTVRAADGTALYDDGSISDLTLRHRLEDQLRQAQKMEALGKLAGGVAHDFNNLLTAIGGYADLLRSALPEGTAPRRDAEHIVATANRASQLTGQLLAYSRRQHLEPQVVDLSEVVRSMGSMLHRLIRADIRLVVTAPAEPLWVRVDRGQMEQVVLNLVLNARDAMPGGGTLNVTTAARAADEARPQDVLTALGGPFAELLVRDEGVGMDAEARRRAFDPFFTTKEPGRGTGLGLSTVQGIVHQSGGVVWIESEPGRGTLVHVGLPAAAEPVPQAEAPGAPEHDPARPSCVLVVEDEPRVRELIVRALRGEGHQVLEASDGGQALELARQCAEPIDLVVTDMMMPYMSGREMARRLSAERPGIWVLYVSGYPNETPEERSSGLGGADYLQKPFTIEALVRRVRENLRNRHAPSAAEGTPAGR